MGVLKALSLVLVAFLCFSSSHDHVVHVQAKDFDFYYLVLMWPGSYCKQTNAGCCFPKTGAPAVDFSISGLWTYNSTAGNAVTKCSKLINFYTDRLSSLQYYLSSYWSNIRCPSTSPLSLWRSAWKTYGACTGLCQLEYFETALELKNKANLLSILVANGIVPTSTKLYKLTDIKTVIEENLKVEVDIQCSKDKNDQWQLYRVYVCVDTDASSLISCPPIAKYTCGAEVSFPPFTYDMLNITKSINIADE